jgi:hypothetical protein
VVRIRPAGSSAVRDDEKKAIPLGRDRTPAPIMLFAILNVEVAIVASPPLAGALEVAAAAVIVTTALRPSPFETWSLLVVCISPAGRTKASPEDEITHSNRIENLAISTTL